MKAPLATLVSTWVLVCSAAFIALDPASSLMHSAMTSAAMGLLTAALVGGAILGTGGAITQRFFGDVLDDERGIVYAGLTGLLVFGLVLLPLAALGAFQRGPVVGVVVLMSLGWLAKPRFSFPRPSPGLLFALLLVGLPGLIEVVSPPTDTDELYYHLGLPKRILDAGGLIGGFLTPSGNRPLLVHLPAAALMAMGGESAPRIFHLLCALAVLVMTGSVGRRHVGSRVGTVAALALAGSWSFARSGGVLGTDVPAALAVLAALDAALRGNTRTLVVASAVALSCKYTAAGAIAGVWLVARIPFKQRLTAGLLTVGLLSPWWLRNMATNVHPLFPFTGWPDHFPFQYTEKYGHGRDLVSMLLLPWHVVMSAEITSFKYLGRLNPLLLALAPVAVFTAVRDRLARRILAAACVIGVVWAAGPHLLRFLIPGLPVLALAAAAPAKLVSASRGGTLMSIAALLCWASGMPANYGPILQHSGDRVAAVLGQETRDEFLSRQIQPWPAIRWANNHLPPTARVAFAFNWHAYLLDRESVLGSVEDHIPVRHWLASHEDQSLSALVEQGVTHVVVSRHRFLKKSYPFLPNTELNEHFNQPVRLLDELLLMQAELLYQENGTRVYALEGSMARSAP